MKLTWGILMFKELRTFAGENIMWMWLLVIAFWIGITVLHGLHQHLHMIAYILRELTRRGEWGLITLIALMVAWHPLSAGYGLALTSHRKPAFTRTLAAISLLSLAEILYLMSHERFTAGLPTPETNLYVILTLSTAAVQFCDLASLLLTWVDKFLYWLNKRLGGRLDRWLGV